MPDVVLNEDTPKALEQALDTFQEAEQHKGNKISSIQRDTNEFIACFNWISQEYRLNWRPVKASSAPVRKLKMKKRSKS